MLVDEIVDIHPASQGKYGLPRVHGQLRHRGRRVSRKRVARITSSFASRMEWAAFLRYSISESDSRAIPTAPSEAHDDAGAAQGPFGDRHIAAMCLRDTSDDRQSKPGASLGARP